MTGGMTLRAAVIGCGRMGATTRDSVREAVPPGWLPLAHAEALDETTGFELDALCDVDPAALSAAGARYGCANLYADPDAMVRDRRPDVVTIATRTPGRADLVARLAEAGVRALHVEKPLCNNLREGTRAAAALHRYRTAFSYGTLRRYMPIYRRALEIVLAGEIGEPLQVLLAFGPGRLMWTHPHSVDLMLLLCGGASAATVRAAVEIRPGAVAGDLVDDDPLVRMAHVEFQNGMVGSITLAGGSDVTIAGTRGAVRVMADGAALIVEREGAQGGAGYFLRSTIEQPRQTASGLQIALRELHAATVDGIPTSMSIDEALQGQRILFAMVLSSLQRGAAFDPAKVPPDFTVSGRSGALPA
jgi:scyllo-inositol 2-dehydrogenase (NAD+)